MSRKIMFSVIVLGALGVASTFGAVAYRSAAAASNSSAASPVAALSAALTSVVEANTALTDTQRLDSDEVSGRGFAGATDEYLAAALGITTDELTAAYTAAKEAGIAQAVEQGLITQARADEMLAGDSDEIGRHAGEWFKSDTIDFQALFAEALGISVEELEQAQLAAQSARLDQAVADGLITQEQADLMKGRSALFNDSAFQTSMQSAFEAAVAQAVSDGVITQAQADPILAQIADHGGLFGRDGFGLGMDGGRGHGGGHGGPGGRGGHGDGDFAPDTMTPDTTAPTSSEG